MTINLANNNPRIAYSLAQGSTQQTFAIPFEFFNNSDVTVYIDGTLKSEGTHYSLTGGDGSTGNVVFNTTVTGATGGSTIVIFRLSDIERTSDFSAGADINRAALNEQLDILTAMIADQDDRIDRTIQVNDYEVAPSLILPTIANRKGKVLAFNATTGAVEAGPSVSAVDTVANTAADIQTVADNIVVIQQSPTNATNAAASASAASSSASAASSSASAAASSASAASSSASSAAASFDSFDDRYLGAKTTDPTLDNDGNALLTGALYFNSVSSEMRVYSGSSWVVAYAGVSGLAGGSGSSLIGYNQGGTSAVNRTVQDRLRERISVKDFGAVGDGSTNDTAAILAAISAAAASKYGLFFESGKNYLVASPLSFSNSGNTVPRWVDFNGCVITASGSFSGSSVVYVENPQGKVDTFWMKNAYIDATGVSYGFYMKGGQDGLYSSLQAVNATSHGFLIQGETGFGIYYNVFDTCKAGGSTKGNGGDGFRISGVGSRFANGNTFLNCASQFNAAGGFRIGISSGNTFIGCAAEENVADAGFVFGDNVTSVSIVGGFTENNYYSGTDTSFRILSGAAVDNIRISGGRHNGTRNGNFTQDGIMYDTTSVGDVTIWNTDLSVRKLDVSGAIVSSNNVSNSIGQLYSLRNVLYLTTGTAATYTPTSGTKAIRVTCVGGGGGGGGVDGQGAGTAAAAGGGGAGGKTEIFTTSVAASYTYTVGAAGSGGAAGDNAGATGGTTTFSGTGVSLSASGGSGGAGRTASSSAVAAAGGQGGTASGGGLSNRGSTGFAGQTASGNTTSQGNGGASGYGFGGTGDFVSGGTGGGAGGNALLGFGGGGGGASVTTQTTNYAGGDGAGGLIIVEELA